MGRLRRIEPTEPGYRRPLRTPRVSERGRRVCGGCWQVVNELGVGGGEEELGWMENGVVGGVARFRKAEMVWVPVELWYAKGGCLDQSERK